MGWQKHFHLFSSILLLALHPTTPTLAAEIPLLKLAPEYIGEEKGQSKATRFLKVTYFDDPIEQKEHGLKIKNGKLVDFKQVPLHTLNVTYQNADGIVNEDFGKAIVVMDQDDQFLFSKNSKAFSVHHSSLSNGKPVKFAGEIAVKDGVLISITDSSGHYKPSLRHTHLFLKKLEQQGVDLSSVKIRTQALVIKDFLLSNPTPVELKDFIHFSLEDALVQASWEINPNWLLKYKPLLQDVFKKQPQELNRLFEQLNGKYLSAEIQEMLFRSIEKNAANLFSDPKRLRNFIRNFSPNNIVDLLHPPVANLLHRATQHGLQSLTPAELKQIGVLGIKLKKVKPELAAEMDQKILKISKNLQRADLESFYLMLGTNSTTPYEELTAQAKQTLGMHQGVQSCDLKSFLGKAFIQN